MLILIIINQKIQKYFLKIKVTYNFKQFKYFKMNKNWLSKNNNNKNNNSN